MADRSMVIVRDNPTRRLHVQLTEDEARKFQDLCVKLGLSKTECVRLLISLPIDYLDHRSSAEDACSAPLIGIDAKTMRSLFVELNRWGHNLNQAIRTLNGIGRQFAHNPNKTETMKLIAENTQIIYSEILEVNDAVSDIRSFLEDISLKSCVPIYRKAMDDAVSEAD